jgi:hypothetical protein
MHLTWRQIVKQNPGSNKTTEAVKTGTLQRGWANNIKLGPDKEGGKVIDLNEADIKVDLTAIL